MNKILVIEDDEGLYTLIKGKLQQHFEIVICHSFDELFAMDLPSTEFLLSIANYRMSDAMNGEVVEFVLANEIPVIVFTSEEHLSLKNNYRMKGVISVVNKNSVNEVIYNLSIIERLSKNRYAKVLVVGDSKKYRKRLSGELRNQLFTCLECSDGHEALNILKKDNKIKVVITDNDMYETSGIELTRHIRRNYKKEKMGVIAVMQDSDKDTISAFLRAGANDIMEFDFTKEEFISRMTNTMESLENFERMESAAHRDYLTGLFNRRHFYYLTYDFIKQIQVSDTFALAMIDIDYFKNVNDTYGHDIGDLVIKMVADIFSNNTKNSDIVCRFGGEEFLILLKNIDKENAISLLKRIKDEIEIKYVKNDKEEIHITVSIGIYMRDNNDINLEDMIKKADEKLYKSKENGRNQITI